MIQQSQGVYRIAALLNPVGDRVNFLPCNAMYLHVFAIGKICLEAFLKYFWKIYFVLSMYHNIIY